MGALFGVILIAVFMGALAATPEHKAHAQAWVRRFEPWAWGVTAVVVALFFCGWVVSAPR